MARSIWTGFLSFGLVSVPVGLYPATADRTIHFNQLQRGTSDRIRYKKVNERTDAEVDSSDIVRGFDLGGGEYVIVSPDDLKQAAPGRSEMIEITDFVDLDEIDPIYFQKTYYLAPRGKGADRAYALLRQAMRESKRVGIATLVMREKEYLVAIRPTEGVLALETMYFTDEVRDPAEELESLPADVTFEGRELETAKLLIESLTTEFEPGRYKDTYRERVEAIIEQKRAGKTVVSEGERPKANVVNLMDALRASLERTKASPAAEDAVGTGAESAGAPGGSATRRRGAPKADDGLSGLSKADLLARAGELGIEGRSKMTKDQLIAAVKDATQPKRRGRKAS